MIVRIERASPADQAGHLSAPVHLGGHVYGHIHPDCLELLGGDLVETSGLGGYFPSGLVIGSVEEVQVDDSGASAYAIIKPSVDFDALTEVFIIKDFDIVT